MTAGSHHRLYPYRWLIAGVAALWLSACVHRIDIQQGNLLDEEAIEQVEPGMTRSQVRFLLGTPVVNDSFQDDRWDYVYFLKAGRMRKMERSWLIVHFDDDDRVARIERDVPLEPRRTGLFDF